MSTTAHDLTLHEVTFSYGPHAEPVLRNLTLTIPPGDHLAILGPSGIGKSTLAGLLCGLLQPTSGTVALGGVLTVELSPARLAEIRTLIPQEAYVFAGTVWDNLTYLCSTATARQVDNAVAVLGVQELVARLGGVEAELAPNALSAGERQLISLVRAYISAAPIVVLDEATCHLDPAAERRAEEVFADRAGTLIVIAHRVSSALRARRILVLDGTSAAIGDHLTLLSTSSLYRELLGYWQGGPVVAETNEQMVPIRRQRSRAPRRYGPNPMPRGEHMAIAAERSADVGVSTTPAPAGSGQGSALSIFGQVRQGADSPLAGATLTLTDLSGRQLDRDCSDAGGHYRLSPPAGGSYLVICASSAHQPVAGLVMVAGSPVRHDVLLSGAEASLSGVVRLADPDQPLAGAAVSLVDSHGDVVGAVATDEEGRFGFLELAQGHYTLTVAAELLQPVARGVEIPANGHVTVDVEVAARGQLAGVVRTATAGRPVSEALATLIAADGQVVGSVITDDAGGFAFDDLPAGAYTLIATGYPPVAAEVTVSMGAPTETVVTLWPSTPDAPDPKSVTSALEPLQPVMTSNQPVMASNGALKNQPGTGRQ